MKKQSQLLQPDARGRIQLPKGYRHHPIFELTLTSEGALLLHPLSLEKRSPTQAWDRKATTQYFQQHMVPSLQEFCEHQELIPNPALVLYGSRARGDFMNTSDFDFAVFCEKIPSLKIRNQFNESLQEHLQAHLLQLKQHGNNAEVSACFVRHHFEAQDVPSLYFSIASDAQVIHDPQQNFQRWQKKLLQFMKQHQVKRSGHGKTSIWQWKKDTQNG